MRARSPNKCKLTIGYKKLLKNSAGKKMKNREWKLDSKKQKAHRSGLSDH